MRTALRTEWIAEASPGSKARTAGVLYLIAIVAASYAEFFVRGRIVVGGDAAATATNILAHEPLYRSGAAAVLVYLSCDTGVALIFYELFKPVSRSLSLLAAFFRLIEVAILGGNLLNHFAPLVLLKGTPFLTVFKPDQLQALALVSLNLYAQVFFIAMVFFWIPLLFDWIPHLQIGLPSPGPGRADGHYWLGIPDPQFCALLLTRIGGPSVPLPYGTRPAWGTIAHPVAPCSGRQHSPVEGASRGRAFR